MIRAAGKDISITPLLTYMLSVCFTALLFSENVEDMYKKGCSLIQQNNPAKAYVIAQRLYESEHEHEKVLGRILLSRIYRAREEYEKCEDVLQPYLTLP